MMYEEIVEDEPENDFVEYSADLLQQITKDKRMITCMTAPRLLRPLIEGIFK